MNFVNNFNSKKKLFFNKKNIYFIILVILIFISDRLTKFEILNNFSDNIYYISDFVNFNLIWNTGIGFGLFSSNSPLIYNLITTLIGFVILVLFYIAIFLDNLNKIIYSIIIGGALGNFYDRLLYKAVPDFIDLHYDSIHWFTFNLADIFITLGIIIFIMKDFFLNKSK